MRESETGFTEKRESKEDLQLAREHMLEILNQLRDMQKHPDDKKEIWGQLLHDLNEVQSALDLKKIHQETQRRLTDMNASPTGSQRPEDREKINELLLRLNQIPIELS